MSIQQYVASHIDPFDQSLPQPKLLDGSVPRSSGLRFRNTGTITLDAAGSVNYIVLLPGFSNALAWKRPADSTWQLPSPFPSHVGTAGDRSNIQRLRLVSAGLKVTLLNSTDDNEGYWEAVRIPISTSIMDADTVTTFLSYPVLGFTLANMADHHTFQRGLLRDIGRYQFKVNSTSPSHDFARFNDSFVDITPGGTGQPETATLDFNFDMVVIKLIGRVDATTPSTVMYESVSNHEAVYTDGTALARLMTTNMMLPNTDVLLDQTKYNLPAIQIN